MEDLRRAQSALDRCKVLTSEAESILNAALARFTAQEGGVGTDVCGGQSMLSWASTCSSSTSTPALTPLVAPLVPLGIPAAPLPPSALNFTRGRGANRVLTSSLSVDSAKRGIAWLPSVCSVDSNSSPTNPVEMHQALAWLQLGALTPAEERDTSQVEIETQLRARVQELEREVTRMQKMPGSLQEQATPLPAQRKGEKMSEKLLSSENHDKVANANEIQARDKFLAELLAQGTSRDVALNRIGEQLYAVISANHPDSAGKLTGMFLEATEVPLSLALSAFSRLSPCRAISCPSLVDRAVARGLPLGARRRRATLICRAPQGHDQTLREFSNFEFFDLRPPQVEKSNILSSWHFPDLFAINICNFCFFPTCGGRKSSKTTTCRSSVKFCRKSGVGRLAAAVSRENGKN